VLDRGDEAIADGEAIDLVRPLAGQLHVDDGDDPFAVAEVLERADNQCLENRRPGSTGPRGRIPPPPSLRQVLTDGRPPWSRVMPGAKLGLA
jgi:hypothetical protein